MHPNGMNGLTMNIEITSPDTADSENESMIVHYTNGDVHVDDLLSETECETDVEIENNNHLIKPRYLNHQSNPLFLKLADDEAEVARAQTRLLSRSHSANDLTTQPDSDNLSVASEPPRRNSSGEYPVFDIKDTEQSNKNLPGHALGMPKHQHQLKDLQHRNSLTPTSGPGVQPSPISMPYTPQRWKTIQDVAQDKEDEFSVLLQVTAERVLNRLKSRQQDLGSNIATGQKYQRRQSHGLQPPVPRKLQPILREGSKTPRSESDLRSIHGDSDLGPLSAA